MKQVIIHTDGSCLGNPGPGGWAAVLALPGGAARKELSGGFARTTNNRMEIMAVIAALEALKEPCAADVYTDSQYVRNAVEKGWAKSWRKKGWVKSDKKPALNSDLWARLLDLCETHTIHYHWIKGHAGHPENERCDELARTRAGEPDLAPDTGFVEEGGRQ